MKRKLGSNDRHLPAAAGATRSQQGNTNDDDQQANYNPRMKQRGGRIEPLLPSDMEARLWCELAAESEYQDGVLKVTYRAWDAANCWVPFDILRELASKLNRSREQANFAATCRLSYLAVKSAHPLRRLPGLIGDLKRTCAGTKLARLDLMEEFDQHIKSDGAYDSLLLAPLSPIERLAISLGALVWASRHVIKGERNAAVALALARFKAEYLSLQQACKEHDEDAWARLEETLCLAVRAIERAPKGKTNRTRSLAFGANDFPQLFEKGLIDQRLHGAVLEEIVKHGPRDEAVAAQALARLPDLSPEVQFVLYSQYDFNCHHFYNVLVQIPEKERWSKLTRLLEQMCQSMASEIAALRPARRGQQQPQFCISRPHFLMLCATIFAALEKVPAEDRSPLVRAGMNLYKQILPCLPRGTMQVNPALAWLDFYIGYTWDQDGASLIAQHGHIGYPGYGEGYAYRFLENGIYDLPDQDERTALLTELYELCMKRHFD